MRIGVIYLGRRGPGAVSSFELATHLAAKADVFAVVSSNSEHLGEWRESGIALVETPTFKTTGQAVASLLNVAALERLAGRIAAKRPDVLLYYMVHPWTPLLQRYLSGIPHVVTVHDPAAHPGFLHALSSLWEMVSALQAERSVVLSRAFVEELRSRGVAAGRIDVIPLAVFSYYDRFPVTLATTRVSQSLLFFGRISAYKGLEVLIRAFRRLQERRPQLQLHIVGEGDMRPYGRLLAGTRNVTIVNRWVSDHQVGEFFRAAEIIVLPYTSASQSGVATLAATFERPVVASRTGAIPEQIRDGETGILVEPGSADALARGIDRLLADGPLRDRIARQLALETRSAANWDALSDAYLESCRKAL